MLRIPVDAGIAAGAPAWIEIDLAALAHNVREFVRIVPPTCQLIAVVKANAYGHGAVRIARAVLQAGAASLAVGSVAEGRELREAGIASPILVVGPTMPEEARDAIAFSLVPGVGSFELLRSLTSHAFRPVPVQIEVDTGMHRHGVPAARFCELVAELRLRARLELQGVYTHFAAISADAAPTIYGQLQTFARTLANVRDIGTPARHACNTRAALVCPAAHLDAVRIGGGLYGFDPLRGTGAVHLRPVLSCKARLVGLRDVPAGEAVGYGGTFVCARPSRLALLPLGYADGLSRSLWQGASVLVLGQRAPIVGLVSMNQTIIDVTDVPEVLIGDECVLLGAQGGEQVRAEDRVPPGGSTYEVTSLLRRDLPRRYVGGEGLLRPGSAGSPHRR